jgi:hypothetical protein
MAGNGLKAQTAFDFLVSYGWGMVLLGMVVAALIVFVSLPYNTVPPSCTVRYGATCKYISIGSNSLLSTTRINLILQNSQQYGLINPYATVNVSGYGSLQLPCLPANVLAGGIMLCTATYPAATGLGTQAQGEIWLNATICLQGSFDLCTAQQQVSFIGNFTGQTVAPSISALQPSVALYVPSPDDRVYTPLPIVANVRVGGVPIQGSGVSFAVNAVQASVSPGMALTNINGNATAYFTGRSLGSVTVTANSLGVYAANTITVVYST